jgi:hypothetical protein
MNIAWIFLTRVITLKQLLKIGIIIGSEFSKRTTTALDNTIVEALKSEYERLYKEKI